MPELVENQKTLALARLRDFEAGYLGDAVQGFNNPFRRAGVTAKEVGWACSLFKPGLTARGSPRIDVPAAKRLLKQLVAEGQVETTGAQRTRHAGAATVECFALVGFSERLEAAQAAWLRKAAGS